MEKAQTVSTEEVIVTYGKLQTILSEQTKKDGYMSIEEARQLSIERLKKRWKSLKTKGNKSFNISDIKVLKLIKSHIMKHSLTMLFI
ncbi:MAG: hypothetical protein MJZ24_00270 [Paludibacteraceae bacterium]|nr:hypothetical protein [Paludibacteraceae bacterium]